MSANELLEIIDIMEKNQRNLTPVQNEFVRSIRKYLDWKGTLSPEHINYLLALKRKMLTTV